MHRGWRRGGHISVAHIWERFVNSRKLSVKVCKTWFGQAPIDDRRSELDSSGFKSQANGVHPLLQHKTCQYINQQGHYTDQHAIRHHNTAFSCKHRRSFHKFLRSTSKSWTSLQRWEPCCHHSSGKSRRQQEQAFCNYLTSEVETVEDCQTFRNEALKLLSSIHNMADDKNPQPQQ